MKPYKYLVLFILGLLLLTACASPATPSSPEASQTEAPAIPPTDIPPTPVPDTPTPVGINAPLVEKPTFYHIQFLNTLDGWGVTTTQLIRTNDGGVTWYNVTPADASTDNFQADFIALDANRAWTLVPDFSNYPNSGTLYQTRDGGMTWSKITVPFSSGGLHFLDEKNGWILADLGVGAGSNAVAVFQTTNGGTTWTQKYTNDPNGTNAGDSLPLGGLKSGLTPLNMQTAWVSGVVYSDGTVYLYRTEDGGANWSQVTTLTLPAEAQHAQVSFSPIQFVSAQDAFLAVNIPSDQIQLAVYVSHDAGNTWTMTPTLIPNGRAVDFVSATDGFVHADDQFYLTHDAAQTWTSINPNVSFTDTFSEMDFINASTGWVITIDANDHRALYRTNDGGATWSAVTP